MKSRQRSKGGIEPPAPGPGGAPLAVPKQTAARTPGRLRRLWPWFLAIATAAAWIGATVAMWPRSLYPAIIAGCILLILCVTGLPGVQQWRDKNQMLANAIVTILGAFVGVFLGMILSTAEANRVERQKVSQLLRVVSHEADSREKSLQLVFWTQKIGGASYTPSMFIHENPVQMPETFLSVMQSETVLRNISPETFAALNSIKQDLERLVPDLNKETSDDEIKSLVSIYRRELISVEEIATAEGQRLDGEISDEAVARIREESIEKKVDHRLPAQIP